MRKLTKQLGTLQNLLHDSAFIKSNVWAKKEKGNWSKLWGSFDNIDDTIEAAEEFITMDTTNKLSMYGILQALVVQQDAVKHLEEAVGIKPTKLENSSVLSNIRNIRDETIGHPTSTNRNQDKSSYKSGTITYTSISPKDSPKQLEYVIWSSDGSKISKVNLIDIIDQQDEELAKVVANIVNVANQIKDEHAQKFKNNGLEQLFNQSGYYIQKLWPHEKKRLLSEICLTSIEESVRTFKNGIKARYGHSIFNDHTFLPGLVLEIDKVDKVIPELKRMIMIEENSDLLDLEVYVESLLHSLEVLKIIARETDERFGYEPEE